MGKINCICNHQISDVAQPNENEGVLIPSDKEDSDDPLAFGRSIYECPKCGNIIIQMENGKLRHYRSPDDRSVGLFRRN